MLKELVHIAKYANVQAAAGIEMRIIAESQFAVVMKRFNSLGGLTYEQASDLVAAINQDSIKEAVGWNNPQLMELSVVVNSRLGKAPTGAIATRPTQGSYTLELHFTIEEVADLGDPSRSLKAKSMVVRNRMNTLGSCALPNRARGGLRI